jgi:hypothetical protein
MMRKLISWILNFKVALLLTTSIKKEIILQKVFKNYSFDYKLLKQYFDTTPRQPCQLHTSKNQREKQACQIKSIFSLK